MMLRTIANDRENHGKPLRTGCIYSFYHVKKSCGTRRIAGVDRVAKQAKMSPPPA